ncbi:hypothetical protein IWQ60_000032 [Tieghemiomyces parasiticus]|uniref:C3H1-type domain-containing protein n=1 Tax=Tieghemiomyces parasiticus TaxID=78921 RepID=A0A9W8AMZ3_9FUNG|nr:hypothetical protein IWQ60_000032 [Tieghemiomyces parasiticus]
MSRPNSGKWQRLAESAARPNVGSSSKTPAIKERTGGSVQHVPCKFYLKGTCASGTKCPFAHTNVPASGICEYYLKGNCKFENKCALAHVRPGEPARSTRYPETRRPSSTGRAGPLPHRRTISSNHLPFKGAHSYSHSLDQHSRHPSLTVHTTHPSGSAPRHMFAPDVYTAPPTQQAFNLNQGLSRPPYRPRTRSGLNPGAAGGSLVPHFDLAVTNVAQQLSTSVPADTSLPDPRPYPYPMERRASAAPHLGGYNAHTAGPRHLNIIHETHSARQVPVSLRSRYPAAAEHDDEATPVLLPSSLDELLDSSELASRRRGSHRALSGSLVDPHPTSLGGTLGRSPASPLRQANIPSLGMSRLASLGSLPSTTASDSFFSSSIWSPTAIPSPLSRSLLADSMHGLSATSPQRNSQQLRSSHNFSAQGRAELDTMYNRLDPNRLAPFPHAQSPGSLPYAGELPTPGTPTMPGFTLEGSGLHGLGVPRELSTSNLPLATNAANRRRFTTSHGPQREEEEVGDLPFLMDDDDEELTQTTRRLGAIALDKSPAATSSGQPFLLSPELSPAHSASGPVRPPYTHSILSPPSLANYSVAAEGALFNGFPPAGLAASAWPPGTNRPS